MGAGSHNRSQHLLVWLSFWNEFKADEQAAISFIPSIEAETLLKARRGVAVQGTILMIPDLACPDPSNWLNQPEIDTYK